MGPIRNGVIIIPNAVCNRPIRPPLSFQHTVEVATCRSIVGSLSFQHTVKVATCRSILGSLSFQHTVVDSGSVVLVAAAYDEYGGQDKDGEAQTID